MSTQHLRERQIAKAAMVFVHCTLNFLCRSVFSFDMVGEGVVRRKWFRTLVTIKQIIPVPSMSECRVAEMIEGLPWVS